MIRIEELSEFQPGTEQLLFPYAAEEFLLAGELQKKILAASEMARVIYHGDELLCYAGIVRSSFLDAPILWVLLGRNVHRWSARTFKKLTEMLRTLFPRTQTVVEVTYNAGVKFAVFCGFRPLGLFVEIDGRRFEYYEVK
ncbi:MAG: hypothetical protein E6R03_06405 [Hyphomicrobiaceae bacterium]|nr:MAG: hypothetical protein E6R03_06405 [Hyphomicrobiaceae bacterium]